MELSPFCFSRPPSNPNVVFADGNGFWISEVEGIPVGHSYVPIPTDTMYPAAGLGLDETYAQPYGVRVVPEASSAGDTGYDVDYSYPVLHPDDHAESAVQIPSHTSSAANLHPAQVPLRDSAPMVARYRRIAPSPPALYGARAEPILTPCSVERSSSDRRRNRLRQAPYPPSEYAQSLRQRATSAGVHPRTASPYRDRSGAGSPQPSPPGNDLCHLQRQYQHSQSDACNYFTQAAPSQAYQNAGLRAATIPGPELSSHAVQQGQPLALPQGQPGMPIQSGKPKRTLACLFCRDRKIACGQPPESKADRTCEYVQLITGGTTTNYRPYRSQCARRKLVCQYPTESRRGVHKRLQTYHSYPRLSHEVHHFHDSRSPVGHNDNIENVIPQAVLDSIPTSGQRGRPTPSPGDPLRARSAYAAQQVDIHVTERRTGKKISEPDPNRRQC
jgi:hypothetical protein